MPSSADRSDHRSLAPWAGLAAVFVVYRVAMVLGDPSRFWATEEAYQADMALALARGEALEALPAYLYPYFAGGSLVDSLLVAAAASVFGTSWWLLKGLALVWALATACVLVAGVRAAVGVRAALGLGVLLALASPSTATLQMFVFGNHAEAALPLAISAVGTWALLERATGGRAAALAAGLGLVSGFGVFLVYSHLMVVGLQLVALVASDRAARDKLRWAALGAAGFAAGLIPWVLCRRFLDQPLSFETHLGGVSAVLGRLLGPDGPERLAHVLGVVPVLGTYGGNPWIEHLGGGWLRPGMVLLGVARYAMIAALVGAVVLALRRRLAGQGGWVLPGLFGAHGLLLIGLLAGAQAQPRYAQQMATDAAVALVLVVAGSRGVWRRAALGCAAVVLGTALLDAAIVLRPPARGTATFASEVLPRFSPRRQGQQLNGFTRAELPAIARWLERPPSEADMGFAIGFGEASKFLELRETPSMPGRIEARWIDEWEPEGTHDRAALLFGLGAAACARSGGDVDRARAIFDGSGDDRAPYEAGATWMGQHMPAGAAD